MVDHVNRPLPRDALGDGGGGLPRRAAAVVPTTSQAESRTAQPREPLDRARLAGAQVLATVLAETSAGGEVHAESLFCALGALGGYACQASLRAQALACGLHPDEPFAVTRLGSGRRLFGGEALDELLVGDRLSIWGLAAGGAHHAGAREFPNLPAIFARAAAEAGSPLFGVPRYPGRAAQELPIDYLKRLWPALLPPVERHAGDPVLWPTAFGFAIKAGIESPLPALAPDEALLIVMQAAVPMSRVDLSLH